MGKTPFKLKGWSPFTKTSPAKSPGHGGEEGHAHPEEISKEVYVDPDRVVTSNVLQNIDKQINEHNINMKETKAWLDKKKALQARRSAELKRIQAERK
jgi:hypothetical protein